MSAEVDRPICIMLPGRDRELKARAEDRPLTIAREFRQVERGRS